MSGIVATLVEGTVVEQVDASAGWVKVVTDDERIGWLRETDLGPVAEAPPPTIAQERTELHSELAAVEQSELGKLVSEIQQVAQNREAEVNRLVNGWQFATDAAKAVIGKNYAIYAFIALILYSMLWVPGLIFNVVLLNQANREQSETGNAPE